MLNFSHYEPIDYLIIGHLTVDVTPQGNRVGGTVSYSALMARALGMRVGIVTSYGMELPLYDGLKDIPIANFPTERSTTFENVITSHGRVQTLYHVAPRLDYYHIPEAWRSAPIVHLGPVAQEVEPALVRNFPQAFIGVTPQGWLRSWNSAGHVIPSEWPEAGFVLQKASAAVISVEDVGRDEARIEEMAASCNVMAVTEAYLGARLYWNGDVRRFIPPEVTEVDPTGAGDIFAAAFFFRMAHTRDPWEAARFATQLAALSVTRTGLDSIPTYAEIQETSFEVI